MAKKVITELFDDLDDSLAADETVPFGLDDVRYEIDLTTDHASELREMLSDYIGVSRRVSGRLKPKSDRNSRDNSKAVRAWALEQGIEISSRGRIGADIMAKYQADH